MITCHLSPYSERTLKYVSQAPKISDATTEIPVYYGLNIRFKIDSCRCTESRTIERQYTRNTEELEIYIHSVEAEGLISKKR